MQGEEVQVEIQGYPLTLTNLDKVFYPESGFTKAHLFHYYQDIAPFLLPHLQGRPMVLVRYPDGIEGKFFYQKECPEHAPEWLPTVKIPSQSRKEGVINYCLCPFLAALLWIVNSGSVEMHPWQSRVDTLTYPEAAIFDLDPNPPATFADGLQVALLIAQVLDRYGLQAYPKTSGASGLHLYIPLHPRYTYRQVQAATGAVARIVVQAYPQKATLERTIAKRGGKVYIDYLQNGQGKTLASVYSLRPVPRAPVSTPLTWKEIEEGRLKPDDFRLDNIGERLRQKGDLFAPVLSRRQELEPLLALADTLKAGKI